MPDRTHVLRRGEKSDPMREMILADTLDARKKALAKFSLCSAPILKEFSRR